MAQDGTEIDDEAYFQTLAEQSLLVVSEKSCVIKTEFDVMYDKMKRNNRTLFEARDLIRKFVIDHKTEIYDLLNQMEHEISNKGSLQASTKANDQDWFIDFGANDLTKESVMERKSQDRIKGYFYKTKEELTSFEMYRKNHNAKQLIDEMLDFYQKVLAGFNYFSCLFNRKYPVKHPSLCADQVDAKRITKKMKLSIESMLKDDSAAFEKYFDCCCVSLCSNTGEFKCQGLWNQECCNYKTHIINPYLCRENLILFQIWNLDHQIEITRNVLPSIKENIRLVCTDGGENVCILHNKKGINLSLITYFLELFTVKNLKLVHIVCHDKCVHSVESKGKIVCEECDEYLYIKELQEKMGLMKKD
jgi:DNA fragmentation factor beta subunit